MDQPEYTQPDNSSRLASGAEARASALGERAPFSGSGEAAALGSAEAAVDPLSPRPSGLPPASAGEQTDPRRISPRRASQPGPLLDGSRPRRNRGRGRGAPARSALRGPRPQTSGRARQTPTEARSGMTLDVAIPPARAHSDWDRDPSNDNWMLGDCEDDLNIDLTGQAATDTGTQVFPLTITSPRTAPEPSIARPAAATNPTSRAGRAPDPHCVGLLRASREQVLPGIAFLQPPTQANSTPSPSRDFASYSTLAGSPR